MPTLVRYLQRIDAGRPLIDLDLALEHCIQFWPFDDEGNCLQRPHDFLDPCRDRYYYEFPDGLWLSVSNPTMPRDRWQYTQINPIWVLFHYLPGARAKPITKMPDSLRKYSAYLDRHVFAQWQADQADDPWIGLDSPPPKTTMDYVDPRTADEAARVPLPKKSTQHLKVIAADDNPEIIGYIRTSECNLLIHEPRTKLGHYDGESNLYRLPDGRYLVHAVFVEDFTRNVDEHAYFIDEHEAAQWYLRFPDQVPPSDLARYLNAYDLTVPTPKGDRSAKQILSEAAPVARPEAKHKSKPKYKRGELDSRAAIEQTKNPALTFDQLANMLGCNASTLRDKKKCPLLAAARGRIKSEKLAYRKADTWRDRRSDDD